MNTISSNTSSNKKRFAIFLALLVSLALAYKLYSALTQSKKAPPEVIQTIVSAKVLQEDFPVDISTSGNIVSANIVDIRPQVANIVTKIHIKDGQDVKKGDLLFTLDDRADRANYEKLRALAEDAERQYRRAQDLVKQNFISQASLDTSLANANSAKAAANAAQVALSYDYIRSPINGTAGVINVFQGALVSSSNVVSTTSSATATTTQGAMVTISQLNPIHVQFTVPESQMASLVALQKSSAGLIAKVDLGDRQTRNARVFVIDNQVDPAIGAVKVKAELANEDHALAPGRFVHVNLQSQVLKNALVVPSQSIISNALGDSIYTVGEDNKTILNKIKVIAKADGFAAIEGVKAGDRVVVEGKQNIRPGLKIVEATPSKPTNPSTGN